LFSVQRPTSTKYPLIPTPLKWGSGNSSLLNNLGILGVNFINVLRADFMRTDPKSTKMTVSMLVFFALLGSAGAKAAH